MSEEVRSGITDEDAINLVGFLHGRRKIFTSFTDLNEENVVDELNKALAFHYQNLFEEDYLYWYRRGLQPICMKRKEVRPEINHRVVENHAEEICTFKDGYFLTKPLTYVSKNTEADEKVTKLNEFLVRSGKPMADNKVVDWFHTVGLGVLYIEPNREDDSKEVPAYVYALDPRQAFVVYSYNVGNKPVFAVNCVIYEGRVVFDVYTRTKVFHIWGGEVIPTIQNIRVQFGTAINIKSVDTNVLGEIPIIEYRYNSVNEGAFETVISMLDAINEVASNRIDGIDQFIQALAVAVNCEFEEGTTANDIRKAGMVVLKSFGDRKPDFKILSEELNQQQTQVLVDYMYQQVLTICGMPSTTKGGSSTSDTGTAVIFRDGWATADTYARNTKDLFLESNAQFDKIFVDIINKATGLGISRNDFEIKFAENETAQIQSKANAYKVLVEGGIHPILALQKSGVSNDAQKDFEYSKEYMNMKIGDPTKPEEPAVENVPTNSEVENDTSD